MPCLVKSHPMSSFLLPASVPVNVEANGKKFLGDSQKLFESLLFGSKLPNQPKDSKICSIFNHFKPHFPSEFEGHLV